MFWMENYGRHASPWNGRNCCIGLEDVRGYFADGLAASTRRNDLNARGVVTAVKLAAAWPTAVNYIQGAARIPKGFGRVGGAIFDEGAVQFVGESGKKGEGPGPPRLPVPGKLG